MLYAAVFFASVLSAMGVGGGTLLLAVLSLTSAYSPFELRFLNLFLFLPAAALSLFLQIKKGLVEKQTLLFSMAGGLLGAVLGQLLGALIHPEQMQRFFALFILSAGIRELYSAGKTDPEKR